MFSRAGGVGVRRGAVSLSAAEGGSGWPAGGGRGAGPHGTCPGPSPLRVPKVTGCGPLTRTGTGEFQPWQRAGSVARTPTFSARSGDAMALCRPLRSPFPPTRSPPRPPPSGSRSATSFRPHGRLPGSQTQHPAPCRSEPAPPPASSGSREPRCGALMLHLSSRAVKAAPDRSAAPAVHGTAVLYRACSLPS